MPDNADIHDVFAQEARIMPQGVGMPSNETKLTAAKRMEYRADIERHQKQFGLSQGDLAELAGESETYVSNFFKNPEQLGEEKCDEILSAMYRGVALDRRARESHRPEGFVYTEVAKRVYNLVTRLSERADAALADGPAGIGKSTAAEAVSAELPNCVYVMIRSGTTSPTGLLRAIYSQLSRRKKTNRPSFDTVAELLMRPKHISRHFVLIFDQAHRLSDRGIECAFDFLDVAKCSLLFLGTKDLRTKLSDDEDPFYGQIASRVGLRVNLAPEITEPGRGGAPALGPKLFTIADIRKIFTQGRVKLHPDAARMLADIANRTIGHLRRVARIFDYAGSIAKSRHRLEVMASDIIAARNWVEKNDRKKIGDVEQLETKAEVAIAETA